MKYKEPTKGVGMRNLFRRYKYEVYLIDEFRTSCRCSVCGGKCSNRTIENTRFYHLLQCENSITNCGRCWNRDINGAKNILKIGENIMKGEGRPEYLKRGVFSSEGGNTISTTGNG